MGMNVSSAGGVGQEPEVMMEINTTPLIDVMLVLLIMLIITIPVQLHSVNMDLPAPSKATKKADPVIIDVRVDADGTVSWNGESMSDRAALEIRAAQAAAMQPQPELHILSSPKAPYEAVVAVMVVAQRKGLEKMGIVGAEQYGR